MSYYMNMCESSGAHGLFGRIAEERYKQEKKKNDDADKRNEKIQAQYKRAGYEDKIPEDKKKADRSLEKSYKDTAAMDKSLRNAPDGRNYVKTPNEYDNTYTVNKHDIHNTDASYRIAKDLATHQNRTAMTSSKAAMHNRINNRVKHECGIFSECSFI